MSKKGYHQWPTDGVTKRQLDKQTDRIEKRIEYLKKDIDQMRKTVADMRAVFSLHRAWVEKGFENTSPKG